MKRRDLFKALGTLIAGAVCTPLAKAFSKKQTPDAELKVSSAQSEAIEGGRLFRDYDPYNPWYSRDLIIFDDGREMVTLTPRKALLERFKRTGELKSAFVSYRPHPDNEEEEIIGGISMRHWRSMSEQEKIAAVVDYATIRAGRPITYTDWAMGQEKVVS